MARDAGAVKVLLQASGPEAARREGRLQASWLPPLASPPLPPLLLSAPPPNQWSIVPTVFATSRPPHGLHLLPHRLDQKPPLLQYLPLHLLAMGSAQLNEGEVCRSRAQTSQQVADRCRLSVRRARAPWRDSG